MLAGLWVAAVLLPGAGGEPLASGDHRRTVEVQGRTREYLVHVPAGHEPAVPTAVVVALHPFAATADRMRWMCGLDRVADREGFVVVYPEGTGPPVLRNWNDGAMKGKLADDVGFVARVLDDLAGVMAVDPRRVYATGMSNGGMMCYRLASELSDRIAAIAPVAGTQAFETIAAKRPVPVLHFHGTADGLVPFGGSEAGARGLMRFLSVEETVRAWAAFDGCPAEAEEQPVTDAAGDGITVRRRRFGPGREKAEVILYEIVGGGHTWPGGPDLARFLGPTCRDIDAAELIWAFFAEHPMP